MTGGSGALAAQIAELYAGPAAALRAPAAIAAIDEAVALLDAGEVRVAEPSGSDWVVNEWTKQAILLYFRVSPMRRLTAGGQEWHDRIPLKRGYERLGVRAVPPASARRGAFLAPGMVLMPSFVNIGAWVGRDTMVDTWATVGSGAQIGDGVHLSGRAGIGGVLEPPQAMPVVIEDGAFIGSRCVVVDGVRVGARAVLGANVVLTGSIPIIDVTGDEPVETRGAVPPDAIVVPGRGRARSEPATTNCRPR